MPQQLDFDHLDLEARHELEHRQDRIGGPERLLMAMAVHERARHHRLERQLQLQLELVARQEFLEGQGMRGEPPRALALDQGRDLVAEAEDAARLEPDHRHAAADEGLDRRDDPLGLLPRLVDEARPRGTCARSTTGATSARRPRDMHVVAGGAEHGERGVEILALEQAIEGVGEQHDFAQRLAGGLAAARICAGRNTSDRQRGRVRRALNPAIDCDRLAAPGSWSRRLRSHGTLLAKPP